MKKQSWIVKRKMLGVFISICVIILFAGSLILMDGCASRSRTLVMTDPSTGVVYIQQAPPKPRVETPPRKPTPRAVWIPGHWQWKGNNYVWVSGHWDRNPRGTAWVAGHWEKRARGWVWVPGHWR